MKKLIFIAVFSMFVGVAMAQLPEVKVENSKGESVDFSTLGERKVPLLVTFWSTTCKPCIMELNAINDLLEEWCERAEFEVVAVSIDDMRSSARAKAMANGNGWDNFTLLYDKNQELKRALNVNMAPHAFIFDKDGKMVYSHVGYTPGTEQEYIEKIESLGKEENK